MSSTDLNELNGFVICEFEADDSPCERCGTTNVQLYWRRTDLFSQDGEYYCRTCVKHEAELNAAWVKGFDDGCAYNPELDELKMLVNEFFSYLETTEESDSGKIFHPVTISSCRVITTQKLNQCLTRLKELANDQ